MQMEIEQKIEAIGLLPLFYDSNEEKAKKIAMACYKGGARILEFTNRGGRAKEVFYALRKFVDANCPNMILGIGSVKTKDEATIFVNNGAEFVVSPLISGNILF